MSFLSLKIEVTDDREAQKIKINLMDRRLILYFYKILLLFNMRMCKLLLRYLMD